VKTDTADNSEQIAFWNGAAARRWLDLDAKQDVVFAPITEALFERARLAAGERVLDVGCGGGGTTIEIARRVGPSGRAVGLDVSGPMLEAARRRASPESPIAFILADAATHVFAPASFDALVSRFGVMFFADPTGAFANLRGALRRGGRVVFTCWRAAKLNAWQMTPLRAALRCVPRLTERGPEDPGPFSFADEARVRRVLDRAGFVKVELAALDLEIDIAAGLGFESAVTTTQSIGAASRAMEGRPDHERAAAVAEIRAALAPLRRGDTLPLGAAVWIVEAVNP
jgi:ubiquinone/menaquinone biosynthesis C-methylase UbiE